MTPDRVANETPLQPRRTVGEMFFQSATRYRAVTALRVPHSRTPSDLTYLQLADRVRSLASGLIALGLTKGERVALLSDNRPRWLQTDLALLSIGGITVPRGSETAVPELEYILAHSGATVAFVQDQKLFQRMRAAMKDQAKVRSIIMMDDTASKCDPVEGVSIQDFSMVEQLGQRGVVGVELPLKSVTPDDIATIVYTSGTTGVPKGVMLTHGNLTHQSDNIELMVETVPADILLVLLPSWHAYERAAEYMAMRNGWTLAYSDKRTFRDDLQRVRPQLLPCVPRIWESIYDVVNDKLRKETPRKQRFVRFLLSVSHRYVRARRLARGLDLRKRPAPSLKRWPAALVSWALAPIHRIADAVVYTKIRVATGGRLKAAVSGGGSLAPYLDDFFEVLGIPILNGYGLTESAPVLTARLGNHNIRGSVGHPIPGTEIRIRDEEGNDLSQGQTGVIWARGPQVMRGYYMDDAATRAVIDEAGWLNTGDLGWIAATGDVVIAGRSKDTIVLSTGENVEPEHVETVARSSRFVAQVVAVGQDQKTLGALIVPEFPTLAEALGVPGECSPAEVLAHPHAVKVIRDDIAAVMAADGGFKTHEHVSRIALLEEPFTEANGLLTQTLKLRRRVVMEKYADIVARLYE